MPKPKEEPQVSPLRFAPVEMTIHFVDWVLRFGRTSNLCQTVLGVFLEKLNSADRMNCHLDRSVPGFPATQLWTKPRVRLSLRKGA